MPTGSASTMRSSGRGRRSCSCTAGPTPAGAGAIRYRRWPRQGSGRRPGLAAGIDRPGQRRPLGRTVGRPPRHLPPHAAAAREVLVHAAVPVPRHRRRWLTEDNGANFRTWARHPDADEVIAELESADSLTPGLNWYRANAPPESWVQPPPQLAPVQAASMGVWSTTDPALTEIQMTDFAERRRPVSIRASRRPGSLDAAGGTGTSERAAARLPAP